MSSGKEVSSCLLKDRSELAEVTTGGNTHSYNKIPRRIPRPVGISFALALRNRPRIICQKIVFKYSNNIKSSKQLTDIEYAFFCM